MNPNIIHMIIYNSISKLSVFFVHLHLDFEQIVSPHPLNDSIVF